MIVRTDHPIVRILKKPDLAGKMVSWSVELSEFGLRFEPRGSMRGQHLANFAVELPCSEQLPLQPWQLYVDESSNRRGGGVRVVLEGPNDLVVEQLLVFKFNVNSNKTEYEVLIVGLTLAKDLGATNLECWMDSQLVAGQMNENFQVKDDHLLQYFHKATKLLKSVEVRSILVERFLSPKISTSLSSPPLM